MSRRQTGKTLYILDEPTTGLHFEDVRKLLDVLHSLVELGNTVVVIEHHLDVIKTADWVIDLGPEGGERGGHVVACGSPEEILRVTKSHTGQALKKALARRKSGMSKYAEKPLSFEGLKTVPIDERGGKVQIEHFARPYKKGDGVTGLLDSLPKLLAADAFRGVVEAVRRAKAQKRAILWGMGGHVVKCGLADILLDLMRRGWVTGFVMNGAASIHDFEIAIAGQTSEDVEAVLPDGRFGAAEETGREMNTAISEGARDGLGMGEALGRRLDKLAKPEFAPHSIVASAYRANCSGDGPRGGGNRYSAHASGGRRTGDRRRHASRFPAAVFAGARAERWRRVFERGLGGGAAGSVSESCVGGAQPGVSAGELHHGELRFSAALPAQGECGRAAAREIGRARIRGDGPSRVDDSAAGRGAD